MEKNVQPSGGRLPFRTRLTREAHYAITEASQGKGFRIGKCWSAAFVGISGTGLAQKGR